MDQEDFDNKLEFATAFTRFVGPEVVAAACAVMLFDDFEAVDGFSDLIKNYIVEIREGMIENGTIQ